MEKDSSKLYSYTRQLLGWKSSGAPTSFNVGGVTISKQNDIANVQAKYYFDKIEKIKSKLPLVRSDPLKYLKLAFEQWVPPGRIPTFNVKNVTEGEVVEMLKNHKNSHAYGHDKIDAATVRLARTVLAGPIARVINLSLGTNRFVQKWKVANFATKKIG